MSTARKLQAHRPNNAGFSLIELLVVTGIMIMLVGLGIAGFIRFNERQQVEAAAKQVQTMFRTAQAKAQIREVPAGVCNTLDGYLVILNDIPVTSVELLMQCNNGTEASPSLAYLSISTYTIPANIIIERNFTSVLFRPLRGGARILDPSDGQLAQVDVQITNSAGSPTYTFSIDASGLISEGRLE